MSSAEILSKLFINGQQEDAESGKIIDVTKAGSVQYTGMKDVWVAL